MAIRRVTDLPQLLRSRISSNEQLMNSFMEISFLSSQDSRYENFDSRKFMFGDMVSAAGDVILSSPTMHGNVYINPELPSDYPQDYEIDARASSIMLWSKNPLLANSLSVRTSLSAGYTMDMEYGFDNEISSDDFSGIPYSRVVNFKLLKAYVKRELEKIQAGRTQIPLLSFVFSDHVISSDQWALGGSYVKLDDYPELSAYAAPGGELNPNLPSNGGMSDDWIYQLTMGAQSDRYLVLPSTKTYIKTTANKNNASRYMPQQLPNITGKVVSKTIKQGEREPLTYADMIEVAGDSCMFMGEKSSDSDGNYAPPRTSGKTAAFRGLHFDASRSNPVYKDDGDVVPETNEMLVYFYIGPKKGSDE